jgi:hypothetical protein
MPGGERDALREIGRKSRSGPAAVSANTDVTTTAREVLVAQSSRQLQSATDLPFLTNRSVRWFPRPSATIRYTDTC